MRLRRCARTLSDRGAPPSIGSKISEKTRRYVTTTQQIAKSCELTGSSKKGRLARRDGSTPKFLARGTQSGSTGSHLFHTHRVIRAMELINLTDHRGALRGHCKSKYMNKVRKLTVQRESGGAESVEAFLSQLLGNSPTHTFWIPPG